MNKNILEMINRRYFMTRITSTLFFSFILFHFKRSKLELKIKNGWLLSLDD